MLWKSTEPRNFNTQRYFHESVTRGTRTAKGIPRNSAAEDSAMDMTTWLPIVLLLGLGTMGLMFLFVQACDKV